MPLDPPRAFRASQSASNLLLKKKMWNMVPLPLLNPESFATLLCLCLHACVYLLRFLQCTV